jgi:hypothetical protein
MARQRFNTIERQALWEGHGKRCGYCHEIIRFKNLKIDHIVPEYLPNNPVQLAAFRVTHGLPSEFDVFDLENLLPSCDACNARKHHNLLPAGQLGICLKIAARAKLRILDRIDKLEKEDDADNARIAVMLALERGHLPVEDLENYLRSALAERGRFRLYYDLNLNSETPIRCLKNQDIERLLDAAVRFPEGMSASLRLVNDNNEEVHVSTCREYRRARKNGYYPYTTVEIKVASSYFELPLGVIDALDVAQPSDVSYIENPRVGITDIALLPATILSSFEYEHRDYAVKSVQDLVDEGIARIRRVGVDSITIEAEDMGTVLWELMRADFDDDGIEDLLVYHYGYAVHGTLGAGATAMLSRKGSDARFELVPPRERLEASATW